MLHQLSYEVTNTHRNHHILEYIDIDIVAQLVEHWTSIPKVAGSIPIWSGKHLSLPGVDAHSEKHHKQLILK